MIASGAIAKWAVGKPEDAGSVAASGTVSWTEANDTTVISGNVVGTASGSLAWTEADDTTAITGNVITTSSGSLAWTESDDLTAITGNVITTSSGSISWTESDDVTAITGNVVTSATGTISWSEDNDVFALIGRAPDEQSYNVYGLRAQFKRQESDEQKRIRREAQGIIKRIKSDDAAISEAAIDDAEDIAGQIKEVIARLEANAKELSSKQVPKAQEKALRALLIDAQIQQEAFREQEEELAEVMDVLHVVSMMFR